jgi:hypothetical protein
MPACDWLWKWCWKSNGRVFLTECVRDRRVVGQRRVVHREVDRVEAEAVDAALQPEAGGIDQRRLHLFIMHVEVGLRGQEVVQIILAPARVPGPARAVEDRLPVVRRRPVRPGVGPHVPIRFGIVAALPAFPEPGVLVRAMGVDLVDDDLEAEAVGRGEEPVEIGERAEDRVDIAIVGNVVAVIFHRRCEEGRQPDRIDPERGDIVETLGDPGEVANPVAVRIGEAARIDLVDDGAAPPLAAAAAAAAARRPHRGIPFESHLVHRGAAVQTM